MSLGVVFSIGGDLIPGLIAVEATVHYGYTLIPETLDPGALIGIDAHAKLLGGLIGFSFGVEAMAQMNRKPDEAADRHHLGADPCRGVRAYRHLPGRRYRF